MIFSGSISTAWFCPMVTGRGWFPSISFPYPRLRGGGSRSSRCIPRQDLDLLDLLPVGRGLEDLQRKVLRGPKPPQLASFDAKEHQLYTELLLSDL